MGILTDKENKQLLEIEKSGNFTKLDNFLKNLKEKNNIMGKKDRKEKKKKPEIKNLDISEEEMQKVEPGILKKASSFGNAMMKTLYVAVTKGVDEAFVSQEILEERWKRCQSCTELKEIKKGKYGCRLCGCNCGGGEDQHRNLKNKLALSTQQCPMKPPKWGPGDYLK